MSEDTTGISTPVTEAPLPNEKSFTPESPPTSPPPRHPLGKLLLAMAGIGIVMVLAILYMVFQNKLPGTSQQQASSQQKGIIKLAVNPWQASELNAHVAKIILQEHMQVPVELVPVDESSQWDSLASGAIHASLEIWPSGHKANIEKYIQTERTVEDGGPLGPVGKIGWYVPRYLINQYPELATWEGFKDKENVDLFATTPGGKGQFYTGDPTWTQYDEQIIKNLGLNFEVKVQGSEDSLIQVLDEAYKAKKPMVFYFWTPHWAHAIYDLVSVRLPEYTDDCYVDLESGVDCDYPEDELKKVYWAGLKEYSPEAYQFLSKFNYSNEDQIRMLAALQQKKLTTEEVARNWVQSNEAMWQLWVQ